MLTPWTLEERAIKWFPIMGESRRKRGMRLMQEVFPLPHDWLTADKKRCENHVYRIAARLDLPSDIGNIANIYEFLLVLHRLMLEKERFEQLRLGMRVMIYDQAGTIVKLDRKKFRVVVRLRDFYNMSETVSVSEICLLNK